MTDHPVQSEVEALRTALNRLQQDVHALHRVLSRVTEERDQWRDSYTILAEQAERSKNGNQ
jgi:hypothetical protein